MVNAEPVTLRIEPDPHNRIARVHEALRDLGLELCARCHVWRDTRHLMSYGLGSFATVVCNKACSAPSREAESGEGAGANATPLATAIREAATGDAA